MWDWVRLLASSLSGKKPGRTSRVAARYDSAQTTEDNRRHWSWADNLSARTANSPEVRRKLRERSRYEVDNNCYAEGIVDTWVNHIVGTGPRLQVLTDNDDVNSQVESAWLEWSENAWRDINGDSLAEKLRTFVRSKVIDGEGIAALVTNQKLATSVKLDIRLIEAEQMTTPYVQLSNFWVDGIVFDEAWNPEKYHVLKLHPGDLLGTNFAPLAYDEIPASQMMHWFRRRRPGQARGIPDMTQALPLFANLRRFTLATLTAAEVAADFAALIESQTPPDDGVGDVSPFDAVEIERGMMTTLPAGWKMNQLRAEHPTTTYDMFKRELINEIARVLSMPYNIAAANSSSYNYSSGRLDHQTYHAAVRIARRQVERVFLNRILSAWLMEATRIPKLLPGGLSALASNLPHAWHWDGLGHIDPVKESKADQLDLANNTRTLADICAEDGRDWQTVLRQRAKEVELAKELGIPMGQTPSSDGEEVPVVIDEESMVKPKGGKR